ncbi:MAG: 2-oxoacid:acceptor oxidoreductase subunit alpha [Candidatus Omnitrophica bacterium]|nr:2-oxoacid:acceptor oxidoreductase subunit alpha [Candidatus Omnitrophota bacterium]
MTIKRTLQKDVSIVLAGEAGQGIDTVEQILMRVFKSAGFHVSATKEYMSRVRGGTNTSEIRVAYRPVAAFLDRIDILVLLDPQAVDHVRERLSTETIIIADEDSPKEEGRGILSAPFAKIALGLGNRLLSNTVALGFLVALFDISAETLLEQLRLTFGKKEADIIEKNCSAAQSGWELGRQEAVKGRLSIQIGRGAAVKEQMIISGHAAAALGAVVGGCNFLASYPMSPSTGVLTFLAQHAEEFGIVVEQAEDEIAAINMGLGSWYAGGRAMVTTSGGGFALMTEGLSLAGAIESPMVIHLAQRPGPATGLPTRTEQGDLDLALYAGHGEFPRAIFSPGTLEDVFLLTAQAFDLADRYQVPVFILTDQGILDLNHALAGLPVAAVRNANHIVHTVPDYKRYRLTESGVSPRGIPGLGQGIVCIDSDEHDEGGQITEDGAVRKAMVEKRMKKLLLLRQEVLAPELFGVKDYRRLIIGWGSTFHAIREAMEERKASDTAFLYFRQVYPFPGTAIPLLEKAAEVICIENNATGQFAKLVRRETGLAVHRNILKYNGSPFSVEELVRQI